MKEYTPCDLLSIKLKPRKTRLTDIQWSEKLTLGRHKRIVIPRARGRFLGMQAMF